MKQYLLRLDDACPTMDSLKWSRIEDVLDSHGIKPMVGIIPNNEDSEQRIVQEDNSFWEKVQKWEDKKWAIAMHGYNHCYTSNEGLNGLNPIWRRSEFAGLSVSEQKEKLRKGVAIMRAHGINPKYFFAPSHTFDENTLVALREESDIRIISDTIATKPYKREDFVFIPQFSGQCRKMLLSGVYTFCLHPNTMKYDDIQLTDKFLDKHRSEFICFDDIKFDKVNKKSLFDRLLCAGYFAMRRLRGLH